MDIKFKEDENGKIIDSDELFDKIDELLDNEEYDAAVKQMLSIPREKWSNKLRFRLINAYSNQKEFAKAEKELEETARLCVTPNDVARCYYSRGYLCEMSGKEIRARELYKSAAQTDPEYAKEIDLEEDIEDCGELIAENLAKLHELCGKVNDEIKERCAKNSKKRNISDEGFQMRLGFFPGIRKLPGFERPMGFEDYFAEYEGKDKLNCLKWFETFYGITDEESFFRHIQTDPGLNLERMIYDVAAYKVGKPNFDVKDLNEAGKVAFESAVMFTSAFFEYLPKAGVLAWDIGEKIGLARHAHRCGIISNSEYCKGMITLSDSAKKSFAGWEEYMRSLIFGAVLYIFSIDEWSISSASQFLSNMAPMLINSDLPDVVWYGEENDYDRENYKHRG